MLFGVARLRLDPAIGPDLDKQLFYPVLPDHYSTVLGDGTLLADKLREWRCEAAEDRLLAQLMPDPIASLMVKGYFNTTLVLARAPLLAELFPGDVPSKEWVEASKPLHMQALGLGGGVPPTNVFQTQRASDDEHTFRHHKTQIIGDIRGLVRRRVALTCRRLAFVFGPGSR